MDSRGIKLIMPLGSVAGWISKIVRNNASHRHLGSRELPDNGKGLGCELYVEDCIGGW